MTQRTFSSKPLRSASSLTQERKHKTDLLSFIEATFLTCVGGCPSVSSPSKKSSLLASKNSDNCNSRHTKSRRPRKWTKNKAVASQETMRDRERERKGSNNFTVASSLLFLLCQPDAARADVLRRVPVQTRRLQAGYRHLPCDSCQLGKSSAGTTE